MLFRSLRQAGSGGELRGFGRNRVVGRIGLIVCGHGHAPDQLDASVSEGDVPVALERRPRIRARLAVLVDVHGRPGGVLLIDQVAPQPDERGDEQ